MSLPPRDYGAAAGLLAAAIEESGTDERLFAHARAAGLSAAPADLVADLVARGYEPVPDVAEGARRLDLLATNGPAPDAYKFRTRFPASEVPVPVEPG